MGYLESDNAEPVKPPRVMIPISTPCHDEEAEEDRMGRAAILWLVGVPIPVLLLMWVLGWLH
jgi:hypothetical protein